MSAGWERDVSRHTLFYLPGSKTFRGPPSPSLVNFGVLPLQFVREEDYERVKAGDRLRIAKVEEVLRSPSELALENVSQELSFAARHDLSTRQIDALVVGGLVNLIRARR